MGEVAVVEHDEVRLEERVAERPAEERALARRVCRDDIVRDARRGVARFVLCDEVARVERELLAADLEGQVVRRGAGECRLCGAVLGERGGDGLEDVADDIAGASEEGVALWVHSQKGNIWWLYLSLRCRQGQKVAWRCQ